MEQLSFETRLKRDELDCFGVGGLFCVKGGVITRACLMVRSELALHSPFLTTCYTLEQPTTA